MPKGCKPVGILYFAHMFPL
uniref:Uncharacterized protein n=1 Tax=Rhizophora mucronata TaxID=61149 RepID=A0A2P2KA87_RHIMU